MICLSSFLLLVPLEGMLRECGIFWVSSLISYTYLSMFVGCFPAQSYQSHYVFISENPPMAVGSNGDGV